MLAVFDREVFEIAQPGIDAAQRFIGSDRAAVRRNAGFLRQAGALRGFDDELGEPLAAAAVEPIGLGVFVEQELEFVGVAARPAGNERRRQMADGHSGNAPLGLRRLARIADDERIDHRQAPATISGKHSADSATALPGSHSSVPCAPM